VKFTIKTSTTYTVEVFMRFMLTENVPVAKSKEAKKITRLANSLSARQKEMMKPSVGLKYVPEQKVAVAQAV
jgi:hypothetical protein